MWWSVECSSEADTPELSEFTPPETQACAEGVGGARRLCARGDVQKERHSPLLAEDRTLSWSPTLEYSLWNPLVNLSSRCDLWGVEAAGMGKQTSPVVTVHRHDGN